MDNLAGNSKARQMMKTEDPRQAPLLSKSQKEAAIRERSIAYKKAQADRMKGQKPTTTAPKKQNKGRGLSFNTVAGLIKNGVF